MSNEEKLLDYDALYTEWQTTQRILAHVLYLTGPVKIPVSQLVEGIPEGYGLELYKLEQTNEMVIQLGEVHE